MLRIYYNPKCSKSRAALARLEDAGLKPEVVDYVAQPPARARLEALVDKLDAPATDLLRQSGPADTTSNDVIAILLAQPELLQRPVVEDDAQAIIARPPERIDAFITR